MSYLKILRLVPPGTRMLSLKHYKNVPKLSVCEINCEQRREYKNFGHKPPPKTPLFSKLWYLLLTILFTIFAVDWRWVRRLVLDRMEHRQKKKMENTEFGEKPASE